MQKHESPFRIILRIIESPAGRQIVWVFPESHHWEYMTAGFIGRTTKISGGKLVSCIVCVFHMLSDTYCTQPHMWNCSITATTCSPCAFMLTLFLQLCSSADVISIYLRSLFSLITPVMNLRMILRHLVIISFGFSQICWIECVCVAVSVCYMVVCHSEFQFQFGSFILFEFEAPCHPKFCIKMQCHIKVILKYASSSAALALCKLTSASLWFQYKCIYPAFMKC